MEVLKVTAKAAAHKLPKGTKILAITDSSNHVTYIDLENVADPEEETTQKLNSGRNIFRVPSGATAFSILGDDEYNVGVDYIQGEEESAENDRLESLEARVAALEAVVSQLSHHDENVPKEKHPPKHNPDADHSTKGHAARKK